MSITFIIGWIFLALGWIPKPFIKDQLTRRGINLALAGIALGLFIADLLTKILN